MSIPGDVRAQHHRWLTELTQTPTAAGREGRVVEWIRKWASGRPDLDLTTDGAGNLHLARRGAGGGGGAPIYFTAHLDHPAFVVDRVIGPGTLQVSFRGGVMDAYFERARVVAHAREGAARAGVLSGRPETGCASFKSFLVELDEEDAGGAIRPGDVCTWELPTATVTDGLLHTHACDDLAAVAAALAAMDVLRSDRPAEGVGGAADGREPRQDVRLLFTRAEEIGFIGAIAACREEGGRTMPAGSRVIALENSRAFPEAPIGGGPIVRVGDRLSVFSPSLTGAIAAVAERVAGGPPPLATQKLAEAPAWKWQRKLMPGGACEATVFCAHGYEATCLCLPLGNYHNMADLAAVQAGTNTSPPRVGPEYIALSDFDGLVDLLVACGRSLPAAAPIGPKLDKLWADHAFVLEE